MVVDGATAGAMAVRGPTSAYKLNSSSLNSESSNSETGLLGNPSRREEWLNIAVIQPSPFCNINCDYCYLPSRSDTQRMSETTLCSVVKGIFGTDLARDSLTFVWHAGEPMAVPVSWYRRAFGIISEEAPQGLNIIHSFQSNGTLIDDEWCSFIKESSICLGLNIEEQEGVNTTSSLQAEHDDRVISFFRRMFERQKAAGGAVSIREFDYALQRILTNRDAASEDFVYDNEQVRPFGILSVDYQGNFSTFSPEMLGLTTPKYGNFTFGSFLTGGLETALSSSNFLSALEDTKAGVERCRRECSYFNLYGGGAPANKYFENGSFDSTETSYCRHVIQLPLSIVLEDIEAGLSVAAL